MLVGPGVSVTHDLVVPSGVVVCGWYCAVLVVWHGV
jgi:hypothetical protein